MLAVLNIQPIRDHRNGDAVYETVERFLLTCVELLK